MKISKLITAICTLAIAAILTACFGTSEPLTWEPTNYTIEEMQAKAYDTEKGVLWEGWDCDTSEESMEMYNRILGYVENVANVDYQIELVSRTYTDDNDKSKGYNYSVSIVLDGTDDPLLLFYNGYSHEIESEIETYKMARKWYDDFNNDLAAIIPGAHANYNYSALDASFIGTSEYYDYIKNPDWRVYFNNFSHNYSTINIILPPGTNSSEVDTYFTKLQDKFKEYRIKSAAFVCPVSQEAFDEIIETEELRRNVYIRDERIEWIEDRPE